MCHCHDCQDLQLADLQNENAALKARIVELETDLKLNTGLLARQTDMAREAETGQMSAERRLTALEEAAREVCLRYRVIWTTTIDGVVAG